MTNPNLQRLHLEEAEPRSGGTEAAPLVARDVGLIGHVNVKMSACVGQASVTVDELFNLKSGDVLPLDSQLDQPVVFHLDGKPVARGMLVAVGDNFGVHITDIL